MIFEDFAPLPTKEVPLFKGIINCGDVSELASIANRPLTSHLKAMHKVISTSDPYVGFFASIFNRNKATPFKDDFLNYLIARGPNCQGYEKIKFPKEFAMSLHSKGATLNVSSVKTIYSKQKVVYSFEELILLLRASPCRKDTMEIINTIITSNNDKLMRQWLELLEKPSKDELHTLLYIFKDKYNKCSDNVTSLNYLIEFFECCYDLDKTFYEHAYQELSIFYPHISRTTRVNELELFLNKMHRYSGVKHFDASLYKTLLKSLKLTPLDRLAQLSDEDEDEQMLCMSLL